MSKTMKTRKKLKSMTQMPLYNECFGRELFSSTTRKNLRLGCPRSNKRFSSRLLFDSRSILVAGSIVPALKDDSSGWLTPLFAVSTASAVDMCRQLPCTSIPVSTASTAVFFVLATVQQYSIVQSSTAQIIHLYSTARSCYRRCNESTLYYPSRARQLT